MLKEKRPAPGVAVLHPGPTDQPRVRLRVSIAHGLRGPNHAVVTACSTGSHAIGDAARLIALDDADGDELAGGTESPIVRISIAGFCAVPGPVDRLQR